MGVGGGYRHTVTINRLKNQQRKKETDKKADGDAPKGRQRRDRERNKQTEYRVLERGGGGFLLGIDEEAYC